MLVWASVREVHTCARSGPLPGCVLVTSHDRWFLDRISTHILAFEDDTVEFIEGNYQDYAADYKRRHGKEVGVDVKATRRKIS